eukprot:TRINITY_DN2421_c0_g4_i1.p1 TRINITY_DN2421_c0_g4~~TRINITY_DN2421_c0_g4_i1.p1  ORF type:complete len:329 (+),score=38.59 TRINITY_DN2421_c0_g4_i1:214-1200(+)
MSATDSTAQPSIPQEGKEVPVSTSQEWKVQILSDLHLEMADQAEKFSFEMSAPYLALLGDIGNPFEAKYRDFLLHQAERFQKVFVLAGNHEYYKNTFEETKAKMEEICALHPNLVCLNPGSVLVDGVRVIGATLWSMVDERDARRVTSSMNDYSLIKTFQNDERTTRRVIGVEDTNHWHLQDKAYLETEIQAAQARGELIVCLSHHMPCRDFPGFAADMTHVMTPESNIQLWAYGHTHESMQFMTNSTLVVSNQLGYRYCLGEKDRSFVSECVVTLQGNGPAVVTRNNTLALQERAREEAKRKEMQDRGAAPRMAFDLKSQILKNRRN